MKKNILIMVLIVVFGSATLACFGGDESKLSSNHGGKVLATLNKTKKSVSLADGVTLEYIGNCAVDNPDADLTAKVIDIAGYIDANEDVCLGLKMGKKTKSFRITPEEIRRIARSMGCGGEILPQK